MKRLLSKGLSLLALFLLPLLAPAAHAANTTTMVDIPADTPWTDTGIDILAGQRVQMTVNVNQLVVFDNTNGRTSNADGEGSFPAGQDEMRPSAVLPGAIILSLIGKIGGTPVIDSNGNNIDGTPVPEGAPGKGPGFVGSNYDQTAPVSGRLFLGYNDIFFPDNEQSFTVTVTLTSIGTEILGTKEVEGDFIQGGFIRYTITLNNLTGVDQPDLAGDEFFDQLPPEVRLESASATSGVVTSDRIAGTVAWNGTIPGNSSVMIFIDGLVRFGISSTTICNQGVVNFDDVGCGVNTATRPTDDPDLPGLEDPTCFNILPNTRSTVPTASEWSLIILAVCLGAGLVFTRFRMHP